MKKLLLLLLCGFAFQAFAIEVIDDRGVTVNLRTPPQRIVTLLPSLTETVCELGACKRLVGVDTYSNWPESVRNLPHVGGVDDANIESIVALKPDLVLLSVSSRALSRLESLGVPVLGLELKTLADVHRTLAKVGEALKTPGARKISALINAGIDDAARQVPASMRGVTVYFEIADGPYAASESSHIGEMLSRIGAANVVPGHLGSVPKLNPEFVVRADPQLIMISVRDAAALKDRPGWNRIRAIREGRICALTAAQGDVIVRPGPRLAEAARILVQCLKLPAKGP
ncbi:MAG TPA: helical backbone metal receptor [Ramlibacter sp.]|nr:helical backbone metal receptor [Ramlibacter sp.]